MVVKFKGYECGYRIAALALDERARDRVLEDGLSVIYVNGSEVVLFPDEVLLSADPADVEQIRLFNSHDVFSVEEDGVLRRRYDDKSGDNFFFVTGQCNSNCVMCPSPESARRHAPKADVAELIEIARHIPADTPHLTITGGEPFLAGEDLFRFTRFLKGRFPFTEFLLLTNGRVFSIGKYVELLKETIPDNSIVAIPIHGSCSAKHDLITQAPGSFEQTRRGIRRLLRAGIRVEIRLVVSGLNIDDFDEIADLIIAQFSGVQYVSVIAMEMTGSARANKERVWVSYRDSFAAISGALRKLIESGVDVKLYNFPICTVDKSFWTLCEKTISASKIRFAEKCDECRHRPSCGGVFAGTYKLEEEELRPIQ